MLQLACTVIRDSLLQFISYGQRFDIIYDSTRELMRGIGFLENYRGSAEWNVEAKESGEECLNEDFRRRQIGFFVLILAKTKILNFNFYSLPGNRCGNIRPCRLNSHGYRG